MEKAFYAQPTVKVAKQLLGKLLIYDGPEGPTSGVIVETEAYLGGQDPASHAFGGQTARNAAMFGPGGTAYVYFTYGMHYCVNVVTAHPGEAVLIRALEPVEGIGLMKARRGTDNLLNLCSGPAKLVQAMGITKDLNGSDILKGKLRVEPMPAVLKREVAISKRIGIKKAIDEPLRFYLKDNPFVSK